MVDIQSEVDKNYEAFETMLPSLIDKHRGKFALMKDARVISFFSSSDDARSAAAAFIPDAVYSIQQVSIDAIDLGFYTYAIPVD